MSWSDRIKLSWNTFTRSAGPLYAWTLIFGAGATVVIFLMIFGTFLSIPDKLQTLENLEYGVPGYALDSATELWNYFSPFFTLFILICIFTIIATAIFMTGSFHIIRKGYQDKAAFLDFKLSGFGRLLLLQLIYFGIFLLLSVFWGVIALIITSSASLITFTILYFIIFLVLYIFLAPWLSILSFYIVHHSEWAFGETLSISWRFFRRNMGTLWGMLGFLALINLGILVLQEISVFLGGIASLLAAPFITVTIGTWVLSLEEPEPPVNNNRQNLILKKVDQPNNPENFPLNPT